MEIHEAAEMYLETILILRNRNGEVRSIDIAREMGYSKPTISIKMKQFREEGLITVDDEGYIELTEKGRDVAEMIYERHQILTKFLISLGVEEDIAADDACLIEHDLHPETFERIKEYYHKVLA